MRIIYIIFILICNHSLGQSKVFQDAGKWKLYDVSGQDLFRYSADTLKHFAYYPLNDDSIRSFLKEVKELPSNDAPVWMGGPHIATYELDGETYKLDISHYGGFFFDERTKRYYQVSDDRVEEWLSYIRSCFVAGHRDR